MDARRCHALLVAFPNADAVASLEHRWLHLAFQSYKPWKQTYQAMEGDAPLWDDDLVLGGGAP